jgi:hypothetical protein
MSYVSNLRDFKTKLFKGLEDMTLEKTQLPKIYKIEGENHSKFNNFCSIEVHI